MFLKYQSELKALDIQALYYNMEPDYECCEMEQSMAHHQDPNIPQHLNAARLAEFKHQDEIIALNEKIAELTKQIGGQPETHKDIVLKQTLLYSKKAKKFRKRREEFVKQWWGAVRHMRCGCLTVRYYVYWFLSMMSICSSYLLEPLPELRSSTTGPKRPL